MNLEEYDSRVPLYAEDEFQYGINFKAKVSSKPKIEQFQKSKILELRFFAI